MSDGIEEFHLPVVVVGAKTLGLSRPGTFKDLLNLAKIERDKGSYGGKDECLFMKAKIDRLLPLFALSSSRVLNLELKSSKQFNSTLSKSGVIVPTLTCSFSNILSC